MIPPNWNGPFPGQAHVDNHNEAHSGAYVGQQVGAHYGDTTIHHDRRTYHINHGDRPERKYEVARNFLSGGTPREAEQILRQLWDDAHVSTEIAYHYLLSMVSDRSFHDLDGALLRSINSVRKMCVSRSRDAWSEAVDVAWRLMRSVHSEVAGEPGNNDIEDVLDAYGKLPEARQDEIAQHLGMILSGVVQERLDAEHSHRVVTERMKSARVSRAWKFFEPEPAQPLLYPPPPARAGQGNVGGVVVGGAVVLLGVVTALVNATATSILIDILLGFPFLAGAGYLIYRHGGAREAVKLRNAVKRREVAPPQYPVVPRSPGHWVSTAFVEEVHRLVDSSFSAVRPHVAGDWPGYTAGVRAHLKQRFVDQYGNAQVPANSINWLIRWHAQHIAAGWRDNMLARNQIPVEPRDNHLFQIGVAAGALGLLALLFGSGFMPPLFVGVGGFFAARGALRIKGGQELHVILRHDAQRLHEAENHAYQEWCGVLADRPSDGEMAHWLAMDKAYLKDNVIKRANLSARNLVTHVVMTEGARGALRARVLHGPPRFSRYVVQVFLLTLSGVRETRIELDFLTGVAWDERRHLFRYDALASASVTERGLRATRGEGPQAEEVERLRSRAFHLTLVNGRDISVVAENFRNQQDDSVEDESELFDVALQTSGIDAALPILEAVAAEGADWIARDQERREQWSRDWYE
ncbi:hypothetical protein [Goodfellowiella coeruleoviolacea]|uniref:Uncharacterized protein n=1 Tax=Goodfellowiella coeruleoviolacea TaxID=334858 RepID=A0AAE3KI73_9PSEU|nr:hypothetical protein [Goodfellowiella coeruleoviolacea]MCP2167119.1 hypothetical protein [Goodfellowiella coeruleoviolacea]